jgi:extracellular factor (EF) 3-hydroxypalmitic acid methyl ester biosynthesis protein
MLETLQTCVNDLLETASNLPSDQLLAHHRIASSVHVLCGIVREVESAGFSRSNILEVLQPARELHAQSPFIARLQTWPRGYPGDFETIEYICENTVKASPESAGFYLEYQALNTLAAQQHRNKIRWQSECIQQAVFSNQNAHILSIACGSSRDIRSICKLLARTDALFFLNDADLDALQYSLCYLENMLSQIKLIPGDVFKSIRSFQISKPYHQILAGGLFDYLTERQIKWLTPKLVELLHPGGVLCFTNIANDNPDRVWIEYLADWHIIERTESDIERMVYSSCDASKINLNIERDSTNLTLLVEIKKI